MPILKKLDFLNTRRFNLFERFVLYCWWVVAFFLLTFGLYEQGVKKRSKDYEKLLLQEQLLKVEIKKELAIQEGLQRRINSQSDPAWIELVLMQKLGLVPEGKTKVFFQNRQGAEK